MIKYRLFPTPTIFWKFSEDKSPTFFKLIAHLMGEGGSINEKEAKKILMNIRPHGL